MPRGRRSSTRRRGTRRTGKRQRGRGAFVNFFKKVGSFFKRHKIISTIGNALGSVGVPYAGTVGKVAGAIGLGRRRRGGSLRLAGGRCIRR